MNYAVIGAGRMGCALIRGIIASGLATGDSIAISSKHPESAKKTATSLGTRAAASNTEAIAHADIVFLCVKPVQALEVVSALSPHLSGKLLISIVAGIRSHDILQAAGAGVRIIRTMPNTAVRLRKGLTALAPDGSCTAEDLALALKLFSSVGTALIVEESHLDAVTAVSGSGPAFALLMLEALTHGGLEGGLTPETARQCAAAALSAAASLLLETGETPLSLRKEITSPGGTTAAGLQVLEEGRFSHIVKAAIHAARQRSIELSTTIPKA